MEKLYIFDATAGYPAPCIGREADLGLDPVARTGLPGAVAKPADGLEEIRSRYLSLDAPPPAGEILVSNADQADDLARSSLGARGILSLTVIAGALVHIVRNRVSGLTAVEQAALDLIAAELPDVATLRTLLQRGGLGKDLAKAKAILETLAGS